MGGEIHTPQVLKESGGELSAASCVNCGVLDTFSHWTVMVKRIENSISGRESNMH